MTDIYSILKGDDILVELGGDINFSDVSGIRKRIEHEAALYSDKKTVVVDMEAVRFANHHFAHFLHCINKELRPKNRMITVTGLEKNLFDFFSLYYEGEVDAPHLAKRSYCLRRER